jgi:hypothetical protein
MGASSALGVSGELDGSGALGGVDLTGAICLLIWTATSAAQGHLHYFWPFW